MSHLLLALLTAVLLVGCTDDDEEGPVEGGSDQVISYFLWEPEGSPEDHLSVEVNEEGILVVVTGDKTETLSRLITDDTDSTIAIGNFDGCEFGTRVRVEFFDRSFRRVYLEDGSSSITVPDGCDEFEATVRAG